MTNKILERKQKFDLEERTAKFGENIIIMAKGFERNTINTVLIRQIIRSATSIGANYMEADSAESKKDFKHKIGICRKESKETLHWLRMLASANSNKKEDLKQYWKEGRELLLIFSAIFNKQSI